MVTVESTAAPAATATRRWQPVLAGELAAAAVFAAREVAARLRDPSRVEAAAAATLAQTAFPQAAAWSPASVSQGYAGLALLWGYLDDVFPGEGWDATAKAHLELAVRGAEAGPHGGPGLFAGTSGLAFAAWRLSRGGTRYRRLLGALDGEVARRAAEAAGRVLHAEAVGVGDFDAISGLSGTGAYLLCRRHEPGVEDALAAVVRALLHLGAVEDGIPRWHTPHRLLWDEAVRARYPLGNANCGLAHGIPGPLAFLSLACLGGVEVPGLPERVAAMADWLCRNRVDDAWGVNWPTVAPLAEAGGRLACPPPASTGEPTSRCAWCYGSPGVARALWLAGAALGRDAYRDLAVSALEAVFRRPVAERRIDSPTFCHGVAGLLQVALRFAHDAGEGRFAEASRALARQLLGAYRPESRLGFRNLELPGRETDQPGLLDGAPGVALVLLAAATGVEPAWDRLFLLS